MQPKAIRDLLLGVSVSLLLTACGGGSGGGGGGGNQLSSNANLSQLEISAGTLDPAFQAAQTGYTALVANSVMSTTVTATRQDAGASITVDGAAVSSGAASSPIALQIGDNVIDVVVTAANGTTRKTYTVAVTRESAFANRSSEPVIFLGDRETEGATELYIAVDDGSGLPIKLSEPLVPNGKVVDFAVSPDRSFIAYVADQEIQRKTELYVLPIDAADAGYKTGNAYKVSGTLGNSADVREFAWSPNGSRIVFLADADTDEVDELYLVDVDGMNLHKINGNVGSVVEIGQFAWSFDSRYVVYEVYNRDQPRQVIGINSHDTQATLGDPNYSVRLNPSIAAGRSIKSFAWSPAANTVIYIADQDTAGQDELYRSTASVSQVSVKVNPTLSPPGEVAAFSWSPDGADIAFLAGAPGAVSLYGRSSVLGAPAVVISDTLDVSSFAYSPDSERIAFVGSAGIRELYFTTWPLNGSLNASAMSAPLTAGGAVKRFSWSPDSSRVAYLADQDSDDVFELYVSRWIGNRDGDKLSGPLAAGGDVQAFAWSPDSTMVAYRADALTEDIDALFTTHVAGDWTGVLVSAASLPAGSDIGVFSFQWAENSGAVSYHGAETASGDVELYSSLADGGVNGRLLSGTIVAGGDVFAEYRYERDLDTQSTRQTKIVNLFRDESFRVPGTTTEMCGVAYDPLGDALFVVQCVSAGSSKILKYSFDTELVTEVFEYDSQWDYGVRLIGSELWLIRTYDEELFRFTGLQDDVLTLAQAYFDGAALDELNELYDLALSEGDLYVVAGNPLGSTQDNGIQRISGPGFNSISELVDDATAAWPNPAFGYQRSIVSVGAGTTARLVVATGPSGDLERWDLSGNLQNSVAGFGDYYLQADSSHRIYVVSASLANSNVTRWESDLSQQATFPFAGTLNNGPNARFVLRERGTDIQVLLTSFRARDPRFDEVEIPN